MGNTSDRSVRNFCQQEAACLRITISGPEGKIRLCDVSTVVRDGNGVRLPTIQDAAGCPKQDPQVSQPVSDLNSSMPDVSIMDARAIRAVSLSSNTTGRASTSYSRSSAAKRSRRDKTLPTLKSTRLATLKGLFVKLDYSRHVAERRTRLLLHWDPSIDDIQRTHVSRWLVEVVKEAYTRADLEYDDDIRAHELRAIASSWAYVNQVGLEDILAAASWRSAGVFQGSYLRDSHLLRMAWLL